MKWVKTFFIILPMLFVGYGLYYLISSIVNGMFDFGGYAIFGLIIAIAGYIIFAAIGDPLRGGIGGLIINIVTWPITGIIFIIICIRKIKEIHDEDY